MRRVAIREMELNPGKAPRVFVAVRVQRCARDIRNKCCDVTPLQQFHPLAYNAGDVMR